MRPNRLVRLALCGPLKRAKLRKGAPRLARKMLRNEVCQLGERQLDARLGQQRLDLLAGRALPVPESLRDVHVLRLVLVDDFLDPGPSEILGVLLGDPAAMLLALRAPVPARPAEVAARRVTFDEDCLCRQSSEQPVQRHGIRVRAGCVAVPGHLDEDPLDRFGAHDGAQETGQALAIVDLRDAAIAIPEAVLRSRRGDPTAEASPRGRADS